MAKFKAEFENNVPKYTLTFRSTDFDFSMNQKAKYGVSSDKSIFSKQLADAFEDLSEEELAEDIDVDMLDCQLEDTDEIFEILQRLEKLEQIN